MKKSMAVLSATGLLLATGAMAESSVTTYGLIDTSIRYTNNQIKPNGGTGHLLQFSQGAFNGSRLGFKGQEDLGNGMAALFTLEMGLNLGNGQSEQQGQLFGRQAFVGLQDKKLGTVTLGRQYGVGFDFLGTFDPLSTGNLAENAWQLSVTGIRFDNTLKYTNTWGPVTAEFQYSFGQQPGSNKEGSTYGLGLTYANGPLNIGGFGQESRDADSNKARVAGIGATWNIQPATLYLNYVASRRDAGFTTSPAGGGGPLANTSFINNTGNALRREDNVVTAGVTYQASNNMNYILGGMTDSVKNENSAGQKGRLWSVYAIADYALSKRTDLYVQVDYTKVRDGEVDGLGTNTLMQASGAGLGGKTSRTGVALGFRTKF